MLDKNTQIISNWFKRYSEFAAAVDSIMMEAVRDGAAPRGEAIEAVGRAMRIAIVRSMIDVEAPDFVHEIMMSVLEDVDWTAAANAAFFTTANPELN